MRFGERLKQARLNKQLTQKAVAEQLHVSRQTISSWENENSYPDIDSLLRLSDFYDLSLDVLLREDVGMTEYLRRQDVRKQIRPVRMMLVVMMVAFIILTLVNLFKPQLKLMNPVVSFVFLFGIFGLDGLNKFDRHLGLNERPLFRERHPWFNQYAIWLFALIGILGLIGEIINFRPLITGVMCGIGLAGSCLWLIARVEKIAQ
ncbi:helix-turn-helix domain-containing protein [Lactiplantibacillus daoliensis]|uniref:Helix-turn-helix domain-containing protein n=1 Tax=Lactiplantibacillus daoliensis TaxID=2559916 RepID=A0ABW1UF21_9LACO|nr:helix-turn-helix transcriptional regulator [Lactiplantibacillus daoliensis]